VTETAPPATTHRAGRLARGAGGTWGLVFFVLAAAAPLTVVAGVIPLAIMTGGLSATYGYIVPGAVLVLFALGFTAMSRYVKNAGAFYAYIGKGLGKAFGVGSSLIAVLAYNAMAVCLAAGFSFYAQNAIAFFTGVMIPWQAIALFAVIAIGVLGYLRITLSARILGIALGTEVLILVIYELAVLFTGGGPQGITVEPFNPLNVINPGFGAMLVLTAGGFIGFEATAIYAEETKNAERSVPRATYIAIAFLAIFYTVSAWLVIVAYGPDAAIAAATGADVANLTFNSAGAFLGPWAVDVMQVLLVTSSFAAALAFHNAAARYMYALGRESVLPSALGRVSRRHGSPVAGVITQIAISVVVLGIGALLGADPYLVIFLWSAAPGVLGILLLEAITAIAVVAFFARDRGGFSAWRVVLAPAIAAIGLLVLSALAVIEIQLLTAADATTNVLLLIPIPIVFVIGFAYALWAKRNRPERYAHFTETNPDRDLEG
jgi:amino acid transporter